MWSLSADGIEDARRLGIALRGLVGVAATVVSSTEPRAIETAEALGFGDVHRDERLREVGRPWSDDERAFREATRRYLSGVPVEGWEPLDEAAARIDSVISELDGTCVVTSHGTVLSAWLRRQVVDIDAADFWEQLAMPDAWLVDLTARTVRRVTGPA